ncbi:DUF4097 family beta strand repeat-containing protein [Dactylosporangium sp. NPDC005555]|uniref:DUF4097 family beta strand repeat-containing protein n=1 Tax=Dactylosporangium sp. NPDC005555 TaxID=3154889 RepID=UPI0033B6FE77
MTTWNIAEPTRLDLKGEVKDLQVRLVGGRVNVVGADGPPRVEVSAIGERPITVTLDDAGVLRVSHGNIPRWPGFFWWLFHSRFKVDVSVMVPSQTPASLRVVSGSVIVSSLRDGVRVDTTSARVTLLGLDGRVSAKVISGSIEALTLDGEVDLETVSGEIVVADSTAHKVHARAVSGSITCDLDNPPVGTDVRLDTVSGEITARVREDSDLRVHLNAVSGRVVSAFPGLERVGRNTVVGQLGAGTGRIAANATSGTITLLRRPVDLDEESS